MSRHIARAVRGALNRAGLLREKWVRDGLVEPYLAPLRTAWGPDGVFWILFDGGPGGYRVVCDPDVLEFGLASGDTAIGSGGSLVETFEGM